MPLIALSSGCRFSCRGMHAAHSGFKLGALEASGLRQDQRSWMGWTSPYVLAAERGVLTRSWLRLRT
jgi:hypothetical protein